jgi:hypothetical protein
MSMIHKTGVSRREMKKLKQEINLASRIHRLVCTKHLVQ